MADDDMDDLFNWDYPVKAKTSVRLNLSLLLSLGFGAGCLAIMGTAYIFAII